MPRGTRSLREASGFPGASTDTVDVVTRANYLVAECWCHAMHVRVPAQYIVWGNTGSCGAPGCRPPDLRPAAPCLQVRGKAHGAWETVNEGIPVDEPGALNDEIILDSRTREVRRMRKLTPTEVGERRDRVAALYYQRKAVKDIADELGVPYTTVSNDLTWLQHKHRIIRTHHRNLPTS